MPLGSPYTSSRLRDQCFDGLWESMTGNRERYLVAGSDLQCLHDDPVTHFRLVWNNAERKWQWGEGNFLVWVTSNRVRWESSENAWHWRRRAVRHLDAAPRRSRSRSPRPVSLRPGAHRNGGEPLARRHHERRGRDGLRRPRVVPPPVRGLAPLSRSPRGAAAGSTWPPEWPETEEPSLEERLRRMLEGRSPEEQDALFARGGMYELLDQLSQSCNLAKPASLDAIQQLPVIDECSIESCAVCLSDLDVADKHAPVTRLLECGHEFHLVCVSTWLRKGRNTCPLCGQIACP